MLYWEITSMRVSRSAGAKAEPDDHQGRHEGQRLQVGLCRQDRDGLPGHGHRGGSVSILGSIVSHGVIHSGMSPPGSSRLGKSTAGANPRGKASGRKHKRLTSRFRYLAIGFSQNRDHIYGLIRQFFARLARFGTVVMSICGCSRSNEYSFA